MIRENIWELLGIDKTKNQELIKEAYRKQLIHVNPEDNAQGFMKLRNAYEEALRLSSQPETDEMQISEKSDIDLWMEDVNSVYQDIHKRLNISLWEELFRSPVCTGLDTYLEARERLLSYLMNNYYLPERIWILFDHHFYFVRDKETLMETLPRDFIEYVISQIEKYSLINLDLFTINEESYVDDYIRSYYDIKRLIDEGNFDNLSEEFQKIDETGIYNPYIDAERIRYFVEIDNTEGIKNLINNLSPYLEDDYIAYYTAMAHWKIKRYDEAANIWGDLYKKIPTHYGAGMGLIEYSIYKGNYKEANELAIQLSRTYTQDERIYNLLTEANEHLIKEYEAACKEDSQNWEIKEELAWCYYQNSYFDECIQLLSRFPDELKKEAWFLKIQGYVYARKDNYKKSLEYGLKWLENLKESQESENYIRDFCRCNQLIGLSYINKMDYENATSYLKDAISLEENLGERLYSMERLSFGFLKSDKNEDCIDICDEILAQSENYYPAYLNRQEAYFNMKNGQGVIYDYYSAIDIYPDYIKPYLLAAKVFYFYGQYEDSIEVIERAKEANLVSNEMELYYGKNLRLSSQSKENTEIALEVFLNLYENMKAAQDENDELGEVLHEVARAYADLGQFKKGLKAIEDAIHLYPSNDDYYATKAYLHMDLKMYDEAIEIFQGLIDQYPENEYYHQSLAKCYENTDRREDTLEIYKKILDINPENIDVIKKIITIYENLAYKEQDIKYHKLAISYAERIFEIDPESHCVYIAHRYNLGYEFEKALEYCKKAAGYDPDNLWAYNQAGYILRIIGRYDEAILEYQKAIELMEPGQSLWPHKNLAKCYKSLSRYEDAMDCYQEILKYWPDDIDIHESVVDLLPYMGKADKTEKKYKEMVKKYNYSKEDSYHNIMMAHWFHGSTKLAIKYSMKLLALDKSSSGFENVGQLYFTIGKLKKAKYYIKQSMMRISSKESYEYLISCRYLAEIYFDLGKKKKAKKWASKGLSTIETVYGDMDTYSSYTPFATINNYQIGVFYMISGDLEKAESHFKIATESVLCHNCNSRKCFEGYYGLGRLYEEKKEYDRAEEYYKIAVEHSTNPLYKRHLQETIDKKNGKNTLFKKLFRKI